MYQQITHMYVLNLYYTNLWVVMKVDHTYEAIHQSLVANIRLTPALYKCHIFI